MINICTINNYITQDESPYEWFVLVYKTKKKNYNIRSATGHIPTIV